MENIVTAPSSGLPATNGTTPAASSGAAAANGQFNMLVANEITAQGTTRNKAGKTAGGKDASLTAPMLIAALMQYGSLFGNLSPQGDAAQPAATADTLSGASAAGVALPQLSAQQGGQAGYLSLIAARLMANIGQAGQASAGDAGQDTQGIAELMEALEGRGLQTTGSGQAMQTVQGANAAQGTPSGIQALLEIRQLFASLMEGGQGGQASSSEQVQTQAMVMTQGNPSLAAAQANLFLAAEKAIPATGSKGGQITSDLSKQPAPQLKAAAQTLQAILDAIEPEGSTATQAEAGKSQTGGNFSTLLPKAAVTEDKAGPMHSAKSNTLDFTGALRAAHGTVAPATASASQEAKPASTVSKSSAEAFDSIVDRITSMQNSSQKEMEISLKPDYLGKVTIRLTMDGGNLVAKIAAANPKVQEAFQSQAAALQSSLSDQGLKNVRVVVTSTAVPDTSLQQQSENRGQSRREHEKRSNPVIVDAAAGTPAGQPLTAYEQAYRTGSVNRLA